MSADDTTLTPASRTALAHYRKRAAECRVEAARGPVVLAAECLADAARWDALADELEAFGEQTGEHDDQGTLL